MVSTKGRYALRLMIELCAYKPNESVALSKISSRQTISKKYTEAIMTLLSKKGLVKGTPGLGGGYTLTRKPADYKISDILRVTESSLAPVACLAEGAEPCPRRASCKTIGLWEGLRAVINNYLDNITLADLAQGTCPPKAPQ